MSIRSLAPSESAAEGSNGLNGRHLRLLGGSSGSGVGGDDDNNNNDNDGIHDPVETKTTATMTMTYEEIMGIAPSAAVGNNNDSNNGNNSSNRRGATNTSTSGAGGGGGGGGVNALSSRLVSFRSWLKDEAKITVHPSVCIVNGEATDGTKNAPVLVFGPRQGSGTTGTGGAAAPKINNDTRCGIIDTEQDQALYEKTMGCQLRAARELKKGEVLMTVPQSAMITPDLIASSDAGRAVLACCQSIIKDNNKSLGGDTSENSFWDAFENTTVCEKKFGEKIARNQGNALLIKVLQERKRAETAYTKGMKAIQEKKQSSSSSSSLSSKGYKLAPVGTLSTRAPLLAFLIHQRFANDPSPPVVSSPDSLTCLESRADCATSSVTRIAPPTGAPLTFAPYARTIPPVLPLPICWKRNELALFAGCIPGLPLLQEVAARTMQLCSEFIALVDAGILHSFPDVFPPGLITWERWVWAAAVYTSRVLPVSCFFNKGESTAAEHATKRGDPAVNNELGVLIPLLDMLNHEIETSQVTWEPAVVSKGSNESDDDGNDNDDDQQEGIDDEDSGAHPPRAVAHKRIKKGAQLYTNYGIMSNQNLLLHYGFAQMHNQADEVRIGWGLMDAVGGVSAPVDYEVPESLKTAGSEKVSNEGTALPRPSCHVYESVEKEAISSWWTDKRLAWLEKTANVSDSVLSSLKQGKKLTAVAYGEDTFHPVLLAAAVVATMPVRKTEHDASSFADKALTLSKGHQAALCQYLSFLFSRKLERLLQTLNSGLKDHFNNAQLWTKASKNGLQYNRKGGGEKEPDSVTYIGWQSFFDTHAYVASMEVEKKYYAIGHDSCVLTLYDGHLRCLQNSLDRVSTWENFKASVATQLENLGYVMSEEEDDHDTTTSSVAANGTADNKSKKAVDAKEQPGQSPGQPGTSEGGNKSNNSNKGTKSNGEKQKSRRNRKKADRPPAIKLHIGNLAYNTRPSELFDFFAQRYGRENVLECHIPSERDTGRSRGFGFVTMPEAVAMQALGAEPPHEIAGRLLKVALSNSTGSAKGSRGGGGNTAPPAQPSDRCPHCGYRPRWCTCGRPGMPAFDMRGPPGPPIPMKDIYGPSMDMGDPYGPNRDDEFHRRDRRHRSFSRDNHGRRYSRSPSYHRSSSRGGRRDGSYGRRDGRNYDRDYHDSWRDRNFSPSRSRSYSRDRDRGRESSRERRGDHRRSSRDSGPSRGAARSPVTPPRRGRSRSRSESRSYGKSRRDRQESSGDRHLRGASSSSDRSSSLPPPPSRNSNSGTSNADRKRESSRKRSRSRSKGRSRRRKSSKKEGSKRHGRSRS